MKISQKILLSILVALIIVALAVFALFKYLNSTSSLDNDQAGSSNSSADMSSAPSPQTPNSSDDANVPPQPGIKIYEDKKNGYQFAYSTSIKVGVTAPNSSLGTYDQPVPGIYVGQYVFVPLHDATLRKEASDFMSSFYKDAFNSEAEASAYLDKQTGPAAACYNRKIANENNLVIEAVNCFGEGGPAFYALVHGSSLDLFVDGYSRGFSDLAEQQGMIEFGDLQSILSSVKFY